MDMHYTHTEEDRLYFLILSALLVEHGFSSLDWECFEYEDRTCPTIR